MSPSAAAAAAASPPPLLLPARPAPPASLAAAGAAAVAVSSPSILIAAAAPPPSNEARSEADCFAGSGSADPAGRRGGPQIPWPEQAWIPGRQRCSHASPRRPGGHTQRPPRQTPPPWQGALQTAREQSIPSQPSSQVHVTSRQTPWPEHGEPVGDIVGHVGRWQNDPTKPGEQ